MLLITEPIHLIPPSSSEGRSWYVEVEDGGERVPLGMAQTVDDAYLAAIEVLADRHRHLDAGDSDDR